MTEVLLANVEHNINTTCNIQGSKNENKKGIETTVNNQKVTAEFLDTQNVEREFG